MQRFLVPFLPLLIALATPAVAQNCPNIALGSVVGAGDDVMLAIQPIGFTFPFAGQTFTDVHICTNGYFHLSTRACLRRVPATALHPLRSWPPDRRASAHSGPT
jgi:hypothetical protein